MSLVVLSPEEYDRVQVRVGETHRIDILESPTIEEELTPEGVGAKL